MNVLRALLIATLLASASSAWSMEGKGNPVDYTTVGFSLVLTAVVGSTSHPLQVFELAHGDALTFIGSAGRHRGARLEQALRAYREANPGSDASDEQVALAIASL